MSTSKRTPQKLVWSEEVSNYLPNAKVGDVLSTTSHSLTAIVGIGILALPSVLSYLGWIAGPILIAVFYACTMLSNYLLVSIYIVHGRVHSTYHYAVRDILESRAYAVAISTVQLINFVLVMIAFSITGGNAIQQVAKHACLSQGKTEDEVYNDQSCLGSGSGGVWQAILIFTAAEWVISVLVRTLSGSTIMSIVGMVCAVIYSLVALAISFANIPESGASGSLGGVYKSTSDKVFGIFNALGQLSSSYGLALVLLEIMDTLRQPPPPVKSMIKTSWLSLSTCLVLYMLVGCSGYASQGNSVPSNILDAFEGPEWALMLANAALLLNMLASYQIFAQALFDTMESWMKFYMERKSLKNLEGKKENEAPKAKEDHPQGGDTVDEESNELMETNGSVFGFDIPCEQALGTLNKRRGSSGPISYEDIKYSRSVCEPPKRRTSSNLVTYATAQRVLASGFTNEAVLSNSEGVFLPWYIRLIDRSVVILIVALISCVMPFFGAFVGLIGTCTYWPLSIAMPIMMFRKTFHISRGLGILLSILFWGYLLITLLALIGAVRSIVVGFSTYKIFGG
jgi:amino acid permease